MAKTKKEKSATPDDGLTTVKSGSVMKSSQAPKAKSKELAKAAADKLGKAGKKAKELVKHDSSSSDSDDSEAGSVTSDSSASSDSASESEKPPKANGGAKANGKFNGVSKRNDSDSSASSSGSDAEGDSSDTSDEDEKEAPPVKVNEGKPKAPAANQHGRDIGSSDSGSDDDSESESDEETKPKAAPVGKADDIAGSAKKGLSGGDSDDSHDDSDDSGSEASEDEKPVTNKRKPTPEPAPAAKKARTEEDMSDKSTTLFVGNLPWSIDEAGLGAMFEGFGELGAARLITERETGRSKGFGYVEFATATDAAAALEGMKGTAIEGRTLNIDFAAARSNNQSFQKPQDRARAYGDQIGEPTAVLFVGNISFEADEQMVADAFAEHANVKSIRLPTDANSGAPRGFGYVEFHSVEDATSALNAMQGTVIGGRTLRMDYSQPRAGGGRGGFGDRGNRGGFGDRGGRGRGGPRGGFGDRGGRGGFGGRGGRGGGRGGSTNRGGMGDFQGRKVTF